MIDLIAGQAQSLRIEVPGEAGVGSEFRLRVEGVDEWHQAKRQRAAGPWSLSALVNEGVLPPWQHNLAAGNRCVFVSGTGADELRELAERAKSAESWDEFDTLFLASSSTQEGFSRLQRAWPALRPEEIYAALQQLIVRTIGEPEIASWIGDRLRALVTGAEPATVAAVLAQFADDSVHRVLTAANVWKELARHGMTARNLDQNAAVVRNMADSAEGFLARLRPLHIGGQERSRPEAATAVGHLEEGKRTILTGVAGAGKSVVAAQVVTAALERHWPVLVLSADRMPDVTTTTQLGGELGFPDSPMTVLAAVAAGGDALLVIDQLDAVSVTSGRHPERLRLVDDLLREARSFPRLRILLACRQFDIDNDRTLRALTHDKDAAVVVVGALGDAQVRQVLNDAGLPASVSAPLMRLLAVPLHLALYVELAQAGVEDLASARTVSQLYDRYWNVKRDACRSARHGKDEWLLVIERLAERMNDRQKLSVPEPLLDDLDEQAKVMASEGVLVVGQGRTSFFHESFFDYCFARHFLASGDSLRSLLTRSEQDLFRRAQVRQILAYERDADTAAYLADLGWLIESSDVRLHIKALVVALLDNLPDPTHEEWRLIRPLAVDRDSPMHARVWQALRRNPGWFSVLDADDNWTAFLQSGDHLANQAIWALTGCAAEHATRVSALLTSSPPEVWPARRRWFLRVAEVHRAREFIDMLLSAIDEGDYQTPNADDIRYLLSRLAETQPGWGVEVLEAFVRQRQKNADTNPFDPSNRSDSTFGRSDEIASIVEGAPRQYVDRLLPQILDAMRVNARPDRKFAELVEDGLWSLRIFDAGHSFSDSLYDAMGSALADLAEIDPTHTASVFALLRAEPYESAAFLLARGYAGNPTCFADEAAEWLAATPGARRLGFSDASAWVTRQLVEAISPCCSHESFDRLVGALLFHTPPYERTYEGRHRRGITELCLLNGIEPSRRPDRVQRRLAELRRKFGIEDVSPPQGVTGSGVPPPIPENRARRMSDRQWLTAMARHGVSESSWRGGRLVGDAWTQATVLETLTKEDPHRFARLLTRLPSDTAEPYVAAILRGLADTPIPQDLLLEVCLCAKHLGGNETNRSLVQLIEAHAAGPLQNQLVAIVADLATGDHHSEKLGPDDGGDKDIDEAAWASLQGIAVLAIGRLLAEDPKRLSLLKPALRQVVTDPRIEVRAVAAEAVAPLLDSDPDLAMTLFHESVHDAPSELLGSRHVEYFLRSAVQRGLYPDISKLLQRMLADPNGRSRGAAARWLTLAAYYDPALDEEVDLLLTGTDQVVRTAAVGVFADNVAHLDRRDRTIAVLAEALRDPVKEVRDAAERSFHGLSNQRLAHYDTLIGALTDSPVLADGHVSALYTLESSRYPLPPATLDVCETFVAAHQQDIGDLSTAAAGDVIHVVRLVLRMHAQYTNPDLRRRCLDLIDQLVVLGAHNIESDLDAVER
ncbi:MAG: hypothetical protein WBA45_08325 [Microthrixaceae bacterium]